MGHFGLSVASSLVHASLHSKCEVNSECWKTGSAGDLSLKTFATLAIGVALWVLYGFLKATSCILANVISSCLPIGILYFKLRERHRHQPEGGAREGVASHG